MKTIVQFVFFIVAGGMLIACAQVAAVKLPPDYIAKHATEEVPVAPSNRIASNVNVIQSGI